MGNLRLPPTEEEQAIADKMVSTIKPSHIAELREIFEKRIEEIDPDKKAALALSGGTDSVTILFSMLATGRRPRCYTFHVDGIESTDLLSSRSLAKHFGLELIEVTIPSDPDQIADDVRKYINECHVIKKTIVQCMHPWLYLYPAMQERGDTLVINGLGGDDLYCNQRKINVALGKHGEAAVIQWRKVWSDDINFSAANIKRWGWGGFGIRNIDFYNHEDIENWFLQFTIRALHKPMEKYPSVAAFSEFYKMGNFYRKHDSYQINSGLKKAHEQLLKSTKWNVRYAKDMITIYNDFVHGRI